jgi:hypothetical protein
MCNCYENYESDVLWKLYRHLGSSARKSDFFEKLNYSTCEEDLYHFASTTNFESDSVICCTIEGNKNMVARPILCVIDTNGKECVHKICMNCLEQKTTHNHLPSNEQEHIIKRGVNIVQIEDQEKLMRITQNYPEFSVRLFRIN